MQVDSQLEADDMDGGNKSAGRWTQEEHNMFLQGLSTHQKQWKLIAEMVKTRTVVQIRTHAQKYFQKLHKSNGGTGAWKYDKSDDINQEQEGRSYAYPAADSRAGSFCSSGDSVDSHGTSAEGVDSEGEAHSPRLVGMNVPKKPANAARSGSHSLSTDFHSASGSTSHSNSGVNSPNGSSGNIFATSKRPTAPKNKGDLARKRSRESLKTAAQGGAGGNNASAPSPKKSGSTLESNYLKSKSGELDGGARYFPSIPPSTVTQSYYNPSGYTSSGYSGSGYGSSMPGPLSLPHEDLRMGLEMVPDFYFSSQGFPEDPLGSGYGHSNSALRTMSNDTDLTNHTPHYFGSGGNAFAGSFGCAEHDFDCRVGYHDHLGSGVDDADDGLMHLLDKIDWEGEGAGGVDEGTSGTADNSRPLSPVTDTASSVGSHPRTTSTSGHVHLNNPVVPFALAASHLNNANNTSNSTTCANYKLSSFSTDAYDTTNANTSTAVPTTSTESVSSELSRLSSEYAPYTYTGVAPASPTSMAMSASIATGIAMGSRANYTTTHANSNTTTGAINTTTSNSNTTTSNTNNTAEHELQPKHRLAFCSVIDELKLVTKVARSHSTCSMNSTSSDENTADHISLFDLFQHSSGSTVGRLPPLRSLVQRALDRGVIKADPVSTATLTAGIANYTTYTGGTSTTNPTDNTATTNNTNNTTTTNPTATTTTNANNTSGMDFDDHEFDFSSFMDDSFHYDSAEVNNSFDTSMLQNMQFTVGSSGAHGTSNGSIGSVGSGNMGLASVGSDTYYNSRSVSTNSATDLFQESILDSNISTSPLLTHTMHPVAAKSATPTATPTIVQRKRGRPRKYSISVPAAPVSTPSATTAKSLLTGPALAHALSTQQYQYNMHYNSDYVVPVNATVLQAFNRAVSGTGAGVSGADYTNNSRSHSGDHTYSLRHSPTTNNTGTTNTSNTSTYLTAGALQHYNPDIRLGLTRTMSSESDTMMANCFDPKLYDDVSYGVGMLEDFE